MLTNRQIDRVLGKLKRFETTLEPMLFEPITSLDAQMYETEQNLDSAPVDAAYIPAKKGAVWGGEWKYCWFQTEYTVPEEYANIPLFLNNRGLYGFQAFKLCFFAAGGRIMGLLL